MNQDNWRMCENHGYNHYSNNSYNDEFYNNGCDYGDQYESHDNDWQWTNNSGQNQYQESPSFELQENQYQESRYYSENQDSSENQYQESPPVPEYPRQYPIINESYDYDYNDSGYYNDDPYEPCNKDWQWTDNSDQNQYQEPPFFSDNQYQESPYFSENLESQDKFSFDDKLDQMLDTIKISYEQQIESLANMQRSLEYISEQLNQPPSDNISDTTHENDVSFLFSDNLSDTKMHEPTPPEPELEVVVEDDVPLNDTRPENEEVEIGLERNQINLNEPITPKVGEGFVEVYTTSSPTTLSKPNAEPFVVTDVKRLCMYKKMNVFINRHFLTTIHAQVSSHKSVIDVIFVNQKLKDILFSPTNDPPITDDLFVINTIDDYVYEHTANMLSDTTRKLENCLPRNRSSMLNDLGSPHVIKKLWNKKQDFTFIRRSKVKWRGCKKHRARKFCRKYYAWCCKTRFRRSSGIHKAGRLGLYTVEEGIPFDPGGSQITYDSP